MSFAFNPDSFVPRRSIRARRLVAVRVRLGVELPSGRTCGQTDREIHYIPATEVVATDGTTKAVCDVVLPRPDLEFVGDRSGVPCTSCYLIYMSPLLDEVPIPRQHRWRTW